MRSLVLRQNDTPRQWGQAHGESFRGEIHSLAAIRMHLTMKLGKFTMASQVLDVARAHLPVLEHFDPALYDELLGIAEGAALSPAHVVLLNHYTDLRDIDPEQPDGPETPGGRGDDGCSVVWARTPAGPMVAQTWDMHATAIPYVMMLRVPARDAGPGAWLFSLTGCVGMAGMNDRGTCVAINNLRSHDARVGVVWPALVRRALVEPDAARARDVILDAPIGSGHHYLVADARCAFGIETSGARKAVLFDAGPEDTSYVHTNHCLNPHIAEVSSIGPGSTTIERYDWLTQSIAAAPIRDVADAWNRLGSDDGYPRSVCTNLATPENPHGTATCGAVAMEPASGRVWGQAGLIHNVAPEPFAFA